MGFELKEELGMEIALLREEIAQREEKYRLQVLELFRCVRRSPDPDHVRSFIMENGMDTDGLVFAIEDEDAEIPIYLGQVIEDKIRSIGLERRSHQRRKISNWLNLLAELSARE